MRVRHWARYLLCVSLYYSGALLLARSIRRRCGNYRLVILTYHSFSDVVQYLDMAIFPSLFMKQVQCLGKYFKVQTLSDALARHYGTADVRGDSAVVTVDDGYADNVYPLVKAAKTYGVPATVFLTTDCIDNGQPTTVMWVMLAIHYATTELINLPEVGIENMWIRTRSEKEDAIRRIDCALKPLTGNQRNEVIKQLIGKSGAEGLIRKNGEAVMLTWDQVRAMKAEGIEFGAHTLTHPVLSLLDAAGVQHEIVGSIHRIREMLGAENVIFAYPYGSDAEVSAEVVEICRRSGATAAVVLGEGDAPINDFFKIPRLMVTSDRSTTPWGQFSKAIWACELEGLVDVVRKLNVQLQNRIRTFVSHV